MSDVYGARALARELRRNTKRHVRAGTRHPRYAVVLTVDPLTAELTDSHEVLDDDDMVLSQWVQKYDAEHTIDVDDTLVVQLMADSDYLIVDIVSEKEVG